MSCIKSIIEDAINRGGYDLANVLHTIQYHQVNGAITLEEMGTLIASAREHAKPQYDAAEEIEKLWLAVHALEAKVETNTGGEKEYPEFVVGKWYYNGDGVTFDGVRYNCTAPEGVACVWSPVDYPNYWEEVPG